MFRYARGPVRLLALARETFEASVAIQYDAPWTRESRPQAQRSRREA
jgi:hypothetical protein